MLFALVARIKLLVSRSCDYLPIFGIIKMSKLCDKQLMTIVLLLVVLSPCRWDPDRFAPNAPHDGYSSLEFCPFGVPSRRKCPG